MQTAEKKAVVRKPKHTIDLTQAFNGPTLGEVLDRTHRIIYGHYHGYTERNIKDQQAWVVERALRVVCELIIQTGDHDLLLEPGRKRFLQRFAAPAAATAENVIPVDFRGSLATSV